MSETLKTIADRYTCRDFSSVPLTEAQIDTLVTAALAAPSGMNLQPWNIIVLTDKTFIEEIDTAGMSILAAAENKAAYERMMSRGGNLFYNAPCMIYVTTADPVDDAMDCGILSQNVALAAHTLGLGSCICGMAGMPLRGSRGEEFKKRLQFPEGHDFSIAILVGTPNTEKEPHELDRSKVIYIK